MFREWHTGHGDRQRHQGHGDCDQQRSVCELDLPVTMPDKEPDAVKTTS
jgi:hypothetical protein